MSLLCALSCLRKAGCSRPVKEKAPVSSNAVCERRARAAAAAAAEWDVWYGEWFKSAMPMVLRQLVAEYMPFRQSLSVFREVAGGMVPMVSLHADAWLGWRTQGCSPYVMLGAHPIAVSDSTFTIAFGREFNGWIGVMHRDLPPGQCTSPAGTYLASRGWDLHSRAGEERHDWAKRKLAPIMDSGLVTIHCDLEQHTVAYSSGPDGERIPVFADIPNLGELVPCVIGWTHSVQLHPTQQPHQHSVPPVKFHF